MPNDLRPFTPRPAAQAAAREVVDTIRAWRDRVEVARERRSEVAEPGVAYRFEVDELPVGPPSILAAADGWTIRVAETRRPVDCDRCGGQIVASGPTGYRGSRPVCDPCLLDACPPLGMVLALVAVTRAYGSLPLLPLADSDESLQELGAFARVYERFAAEAGPPRAFAVRRRPA